MVKMKIYKFAVLAVALILLLCSCGAFDENDGIRGGELLDDEKMSEIRSSVFATDTIESDGDSPTSTEKSDVTETNSDSPTSTEKSDVTEENDEGSTYTETSEKASAEHTSEKSSDKSTSDVVFWTENGSVWHLSRDCRYIKNSDALSGSVDEAIEAGKDRVCSTCVK